ncbi:MAG: aminotransferase V [Bacteroides sp. SM23_62_1]|nr:MAG: aminotransferase V [Bacteroides sp. SM23_62_1]
METHRRKFIKGSVSALGALILSSFYNDSFGRNLKQILESGEGLNPFDTARDEDLWMYVQQAYTASPNIMNLNNGGVCPQPKVVQEAFESYNRFSNEGPAYYMWNVVGEGRESVRRDLAAMAGCQADEIAIVRNTTEALEIVIFGLDLKKGDEVILTKQDYPNMINAWKQREKRDGVVLKWVDLPQPIEDEEAIVNAYKEQFTSKTRIIEIMHMINWSGQILPAKKLADAAHQEGIEVLVDGAHTFAHLDFKIPDLDCDYYGTSLHKWLCSPFGTGFLYVKKDKIGKIWPLTAPADPSSEDIRKFEAMGTRSFPAELAIGTAINFHDMIGSERKEARLRYLKDYWMDGISDIEGIKFYTSKRPEFACGLGNFAIEGMEPADIQKKLLSQYRIYTISINWENIHGVRVTPNVYITTKDLDKFIEAVHEIAELRA